MYKYKKYSDDLEILLKQGKKLLSKLNGDNEDLLKFREEYEVWYSESFYIIEALLSRRLKDFELYYNNPKGDCLKKAISYTPPKKHGFDFDTAMGNSALGCIPANQCDYAKSLFTNQLNILKSVEKKFQSSLFDIKQLLQADLFDNELDAAKELNKKGFTRGAGAIAGVVLEEHFQNICDFHILKVGKKNSGINDFNDLLKNEGIIEIDIFRFIQRLGDLRNKCDHKKIDEPTKEDIDELINGVDRIIKTVF